MLPIYIMTKRAMQKFWQQTYDLGLHKGYELGKGMAQNKGFIIAGIPYDSISPEALNPKFRRDIDDILKKELGK